MGAALIRLHPKDNVLIAREPLTLGATVNADGATIKVRAQVPAGHKIAARKILRPHTPAGAAPLDAPDRPSTNATLSVVQRVLTGSPAVYEFV